MQRTMKYWPQLLSLQFRKVLGNGIVKRVVYLQLGLQMVRYKGEIVRCIEDRTILEAQQKMKKFKSQMEYKYGKQNVLDYQISMKGGKYVMQFVIDQRKTDIFVLVVDVLDQMQQKVGSQNQSDQVKVKNVESFKQDDIITFQIEFTQFINNRLDKGTIYITGEMNNQRAAIRFKLEKDNYITDQDIKTFQKAYEESNKPQNQIQKQKMESQIKSTMSTNKKQQNQQSSQLNGYQESLDMLKEMGCTVFMPDSSANNLDWDCLAGYERQKRAIEDTVLLALSYPEIYQDIMQGTRMKPDDNKPKAVLFEGPPGTGKTTSAKIISQQVQVPLVYLPLESIMSKYYGESEKRFSDIFQACQSLGKVIVFIDEIDAIAGQRDSQMHEASRRILSTLLRKIDGFESTTEVLLICATNRKDDLDQAMLSRVDLSIKFDLPDVVSRTQIYGRYAKQFSQNELQKLADASEGMSGRNISDICKNTERRWASKIIRKEVDSPLPTLDQYLESIRTRQSANLF